MDFYESCQSLNQYAFAQGYYKELVYFYILDTIVKNSSGAGFVEQGIFTAILQRHHAVTQKTISKTLQNGEGIFWEVKNNRIWKYSLKRVFEKLKITKFTLRKQDRPIQELLNKSLQKRKAYLHRAVLEQASCEKHRSSRQTLSHRFNITRQTSIRYTKVTTGKIHSQTIIIRPIQPHEEIQSLLLTTQINKGQKVKKLKNRLLLLQQLPNKYTGKHVTNSPRLTRLKATLRCNLMKAKKQSPTQVSSTAQTCQQQIPQPNKATNRQT